MVDSYEARVEMAANELEEARVRRDREYPGSREWESANAKVKEWERVVDDIRREA